MKKVRIGSFYADAINGIVFLLDDEAAFLLRIGWVDGQDYRCGYREMEKAITRFGPSAPDGSFNRVVWRVGQATVRFDWGRSGPDGVAATLQADAPCRLAIQTSPSWPKFTSTYHLTEKGIIGQAKDASGQAVRWFLEASGKPTALICTNDVEQLGRLAVQGQSQNVGECAAAAIVLDMQPHTKISFVAGFSQEVRSVPVQRVLDDAEKAYAARRPAGSGEWGDFVQAIADNLNNSRLYNPHTGRIAHVVTRGWCLPDGQVLFCWDSFFNALLASIDDPAGARDTVRAILAYQQPNGMIPNMNHTEPDRWSPGPQSTTQSNLPLGSLCVWRMHQRRPDRPFLAEVYPALVKWNDFWFAPRPDNGLPYRDGNRDGLLELGSETSGRMGGGWESGLDDSPMYKEADYSEESRTLMLADVGLNSMWAVDCEHLALIADELGLSHDATAFRAKRDAMARRINEHLWNEELGIYCNRYWTPLPRYEDMRLERLAHYGGKVGFHGQYYADKNFETPAFSRHDRSIDFTWDDGPGEGVASENFSVRWRARFKTPKTGNYVLRAECTGGVRLLLDGQPLIERWTLKGPGVHYSPIQNLEAGRENELTLECFQAFKGGGVRLFLLAVDPTQPGRISSTRLSPTCFYPMIAGIPDKRRIERMLSVLKDEKKFWGEHVCPTIARDDITFPRQGYWQGKIWAPTNYLLYQGLRRCAPAELKAEYARKSVELFMRNWRTNGTCNENFMCNGEGSSEPHYTWGALLCLIGLEEIVELGADGKARINEHLPEKVMLRNIPLGGRLYDANSDEDYQSP